MCVNDPVCLYVTECDSVSLIVFQCVFVSSSEDMDGTFRGYSPSAGRGKKAPLPKICHIYPTIMNHGKLAIFVISRNIDIDRILIENF